MFLSGIPPKCDPPSGSNRGLGFQPEGVLWGQCLVFAAGTGKTAWRGALGFAGLRTSVRLCQALRAYLYPSGWL